MVLQGLGGCDKGLAATNGYQSQCVAVAFTGVLLCSIEANLQRNFCLVFFFLIIFIPYEVFFFFLQICNSQPVFRGSV